MIAGLKLPLLLLLLPLALCSAAPTLRRTQEVAGGGEWAAKQAGGQKWCRIKYTFHVAPKDMQPETDEIVGSFTVLPLFTEDDDVFIREDGGTDTRTWVPGESYSEVLPFRECEATEMLGVYLSFWGETVDMVALTRVEATRVAPTQGKTLHYDALEQGGNSSVVFGYLHCGIPDEASCNLPLVE